MFVFIGFGEKVDQRTKTLDPPIFPFVMFCVAVDMAGQYAVLAGQELV